MSDLISRKAVYEMLHGLGGCDATDEWADGWDKGISQAISDLDDIPTAYDVDKVVIEISDYFQSYIRNCNLTEEDALTILYMEEHITNLVEGAVKDDF